MFATMINDSPAVIPGTARNDLANTGSSGKKRNAPLPRPA